MRIPLVFSLIAIFCEPPLIAGTAVFSDDGKTVYSLNEKSLDAVHPATGEVQLIIPAGVNEIDGICRAGEGAFYLAADNALWRWKPGDEPAVLIEKAPPGYSFTDVARHPETGKLLIVSRIDGRGPLFYKTNAKQPAVELRMRHLPDATIRSPEFLPDGTLMFSAEGDLWHDLAEADYKDGEPIPFRIGEKVLLKK